MCVLLCICVLYKGYAFGNIFQFLMLILKPYRGYAHVVVEYKIQGRLCPNFQLKFVHVCTVLYRG